MLVETVVCTGGLLIFTTIVLRVWFIPYAFDREWITREDLADMVTFQHLLQPPQCIKRIHPVRLGIRKL